MEYFKYCPWDGYRFSDSDSQCFICKRPRYKIQPEEIVPQEQNHWEKILYEEQDYDDNYIDSSFLQHVQKQDISNNGPDYRAMIRKTADLIFAIDSVGFYLVIYYSMLYNQVSEEIYVIIMLLLTLFGGITILLMESKKFKVHDVLSNFKSITILITILMLFSPVMLTVNQTYADNTIYALTSLSILLHLILRDYDYESIASTATWQVNGSTFCALAFSSLLASRLKNQIQVFVMLYSGILFFIFAQFLKKSIKEHSNKSFKFILIGSSLSLGIILLFLSFLLGILYFGTVFFIAFISPLQIIWLYQYKKYVISQINQLQVQLRDHGIYPTLSSMSEY